MWRGVFYAARAKMIQAGQVGSCNESVKRRVEGWCEMAAILGVRELEQCSPAGKDIVRISYKKRAIEDRRLYLC
jgi:hypothetical protein